MPRLTRRNLLVKTSIGAAAAGVVAAAPGLASLRRKAGVTMARTVTMPGGGSQAAPGGAPSVVYVRNAAKGEVVLMTGTRQVVRTDPGLVSYLSKISGETA